MSAPSGATAHDRLVPFFTAIVAVLAALGTLFAHHRSISALSVRNQALLLTAKASDQYSYYQTKQLKVTLYQALLAGAVDNQRARTLRAELDQEKRSSIGVFASAKTLEDQATAQESHAEALLRSFETLEIATTMFEIAIAFASIAALTDARPILWAGSALGAVGLVVGIAGYFQAH